MCLLLREAMNVGRFAIHRLFFSIELELLEARKRVKDELLNYCVVTEAAKTTFGKVQLARPHTKTAGERATVRLAGSHNIHGQAVRQTGRSLHRHPGARSARPSDCQTADVVCVSAAGDDRGAKVLPGTHACTTRVHTPAPAIATATAVTAAIRTQNIETSDRWTT